MVAKGLKVGPGDFAENITTTGIELYTLPVGTFLKMGPTLLQVTQIGKECHAHCAIYYQAGDCVMPREGIFVRVLWGGNVKVGDPIEVIHPLRAAVITASDKGSRGERVDESGALIRELLAGIDGAVVRYEIVPDDKETLKSLLIEAADQDHLDLVVTTGGTGLTPRDVTPDATLEVIDQQVPGMAEAMRAEGLKNTPRAMLSRAVVGVRKRTLIVNLPGSPKAVRENLSVILPVLPHAVETLRGDSGDCARV
jgi:molybdenum cofactor synthesis domain-containing protein